MEDKQIIDLLFARDERGLTHTEEKYDPLYRSILRQALSDQSDIDECANDVLMAIWNSMLMWSFQKIDYLNSEFHSD